MKQQFHIVPVIARLFPFQIPEPQNNGGVIFRPLSDPDLQVIHTPCLVLMMSFVTYIFPFSGTQLMPAYEFAALFVLLGASAAGLMATMIYKKKHGKTEKADETKKEE